MEVRCGQCGERLLIEIPGVVVACPHCGAHLVAPLGGIGDSAVPTPAPFVEDQNATSKSAPDSPPPPSPSSFVESSASSVQPEGSAAETMIAHGLSKSSLFDPPRIQSVSTNIHDFDDTDFEYSPQDNWLTAPGIPQSALVVKADCVPLANEADFEVRPPNAMDQPDFSWMSAPRNSSTGESVSPFVVDLQSNANDPVATPISRQAAVESNTADSRQAFLTTMLIVVGTYASLLTIYVVYTTFFVRPHQLESLPDLKTVQQQGGRAIVPRPENDLPAGHELRLGQSERYGNIRVTPLRVTRGPIAFAHRAGDTTRERSATEPVLKLWLKFENVSDEQTITPIDTTLMFFRRIFENRVASYSVIFKHADRKQRMARFYYPFDRLSDDSEWIIVGQNTDQAIGPHETLETFVPSEENLDGLSGDLVWRVHIRKGLGPVTGNGVTTLIDVRFHSDDITPDSA